MEMTSIDDGTDGMYQISSRKESFMGRFPSLVMTMPRPILCRWALAASATELKLLNGTPHSHTSSPRNTPRMRPYSNDSFSVKASFGLGNCLPL